MSGSSKGSNVAKDVADQPSRNEAEGYKKGEQDQNRQQLPAGNNSRQSSQNSHHPQNGNNQSGDESETDHKASLQGRGDHESLAGKLQPSEKVSDQGQVHTNDKIPSEVQRVTAEPERLAQTQSSSEHREKATKIVLHERPNPDKQSSSCCSSPCCSIL